MKLEIALETRPEIGLAIRLEIMLAIACSHALSQQQQRLRISSNARETAEISRGQSGTEARAAQRLDMPKD